MQNLTFLANMNLMMFVATSRTMGNILLNISYEVIRFIFVLVNGYKFHVESSFLVIAFFCNILLLLSFHD